jgi:hypothetical protein
MKHIDIVPPPSNLRQNFSYKYNCTGLAFHTKQIEKEKKKVETRNPLFMDIRERE